MALVVFTGGARCGKSRAAVSLALSREALGYSVSFVTFGDREGGADALRAIEKARRERPESFNTIEARTDPKWLEKVPDNDLLLIDCLDGYLESLIMWHDSLYEAAGDSIVDSGEAAIIKAFVELLSNLAARQGDTIVVTNEVGGGLDPIHDSARFFRDVLGIANRSLVEHADSAYLVVCGKLIDIKSLPNYAHWPED